MVSLKERQSVWEVSVSGKQLLGLGDVNKRRNKCEDSLPGTVCHMGMLESPWSRAN